MLRVSAVYRSIERPSYWLGLELMDAYVWLMSFMLVRYLKLYTLLVSGVLWIVLFGIRYRRPPRFLMNFLAFHLSKAIHGGRYTARKPEAPSRPWLATRRFK